MTAEVISYLLSQKNEKERLQSLMVLQCAPFLKGIKLSGLLCVRCFDESAILEILEGTEIDYMPLGGVKNKVRVFLYRKAQLQEYLLQEEIRCFLRKNGYQDAVLEHVLERLDMRMEIYLERGGSFPHEIGVLLGYPVWDVEQFIKYGGKGEQLTGYWKVYRNVQEAQMKFCLYDMAKQCVLREYLCGKSVRKIALQNRSFSWYNRTCKRRS